MSFNELNVFSFCTSQCESVGMQLLLYNLDTYSHYITLKLLHVSDLKQLSTKLHA